MKDQPAPWVAARLWLPPTWGWGFFARCALVWLPILLGPGWLLFYFGHVGASLVAPIALSLFMPRHRLRVADDGLHVRLLFVGTLIPSVDIAAVSVVEDPRRGVIGRRANVLRIWRRKRSPLIVMGSPAALRQLESGLAATAGLERDRR